LSEILFDIRLALYTLTSINAGGIVRKKNKDLKRIIKDTAKTIFLKEGYDKISMRNIAKLINYTPTTIYLYYKNKEELLLDLLADYNDEYSNQLAKIMCSNFEVQEKLQQYLKLYIKHGTENPAMFKLLTLFFINSTSTSNNSKENASYAMLKGLIEACIENGYFKQESPEKIAQLMWMEIYGITSLLTFKPDFNWGDQDELIDFSLQNIINSFRPAAN